MITKKVGGPNGIDTILYYNEVRLQSLAPTADGGVSGAVIANGGFCIPNVWGNPLTSPDDGVYPIGTQTTVSDFIVRMSVKLGCDPVAVKDAICQSLEDVYREQIGE